MTLETAITHFKQLKSKTSKKSEIKIYEKFIHLLSGLQQKELSASEIQSIEQQLAIFELNSNEMRSIKYYRKAYQQFEKQLREKLSLSTKGYYTNKGIGLGASFGIVFGIVVLSSFERSLGISFGISLGMLVGLLIGRNLDLQAKASGKMI